MLHSCQLDDLVLKYLFGDGHRESFPKRNPHMKRLMHIMMSVMNSTIAQPFKACDFCLKVFDFVSKVLNFVCCFVAYNPQGVGFVTVAQKINDVVH